jgi:hypothetical protein
VPAVLTPDRDSISRRFDRRLFALDPYFDLSNITVWPLFKRVLDAHVQSLQSVPVDSLWCGGRGLRCGGCAD